MSTITVGFTYDEAKQLLKWLEAQQAVLRTELGEIETKLRLTQTLIVKTRNWLEGKHPA